MFKDSFQKNVNAKRRSINPIFLQDKIYQNSLLTWMLLGIKTVLILYTQYWYSTIQVMLLYTTGEPHLTCLAKAQDSHQLQILTWLHEIFREFCSHFWGIRWSSTCFFLSQCEQKILSVLFSIYLYLFFWPEKAADHRCVSRMPIRKIIAFNVQSWEVVQVNICQKLLF